MESPCVNCKSAKIRTLREIGKEFCSSEWKCDYQNKWKEFRPRVRKHQQNGKVKE